jgi:serine/threonine-protein kinase HipA
MAEEAHLSGALVRKELLILINKIEKNITDSPYTTGILQRVDKLLQRLQKG